MFNRRFLREKVLQACYGFVQGGNESAVTCQKNLLAGLEQTAQLYYFHLKFLVELSHFARERYEQALQRGRKAEELEGLRFMAHNKLIEHLEQDVNFILKSESYQIKSSVLRDLVGSVYNSVFSLNKENSPAKNTAQKAEVLEQGDEFERDRTFLKKLYKRKIADNAALRSYCEERSIFWESDYESVTFWVYSLLGRMSPERNNNVEDGWNVEEESVQFGTRLLEKTLLHADEYNAYIAPRLENWSYERIGTTEKVLLCVAMSELVNFPSIPVKASLNEYIELSKLFCAKDSTTFINGVLHTLVQALKNDKKIQKSGRGLIS